MKIKIKTLLSLTCCLFSLFAAAGRSRADHADDLRNEVIPSGHRMHPPIHFVTTPFDSSSPAGNGYTPQQLRHAYGFDLITNTTGQGQVIALVEAYGSSTIQADLNAFCAAYNLQSPIVQIYYPQGTPPRDPNYPNWAVETSLDVEWAHVIAPGATLMVVAAKSDATADLLAAVDFAVNNGATEISMSWGGPEYSTETSSDYHFAVPGENYYAASGDSGAGVNYPACSPWVVAVGGTSLQLDSSGNYISETAWPGSGGGPSIYETEPYSQDGFWAGPGRGVPDVAYDADLNTGVPVYLTDTGWLQVGGTSMGAPQWAALGALAYSLRSNSINAIPSDFYSLATNDYSGYFHDIVSGSNGAYSAGPGYDLVTGLGTPIANQLVTALAGGDWSQVVPPVFFPPTGDYLLGSTQTVSLVSATPGATIRYTTDGSTPTETYGILYSGPITIDQDITVEAVAYESGLATSSVNSATYAFDPQAAAPTFSPAAGTYTAGPMVMISTATSGASIRFTTDGSTPTESYGTLYSGPFLIGADTAVSAMAYKSGYIDSPMAGSGLYTVVLPPCPTAPTLSPAPGTYANTQTVNIKSATGGASILFTTDGSTPFESDGIIYNGMPYTGPVSIDSTVVLKAIAYKTGIYSGGPTAGGVYSVSSAPAVAVNVLYDFSTVGNVGTRSFAALAQGTDGNFYGSTGYGGSNGAGTIFKMTPAGAVTVLFSCSNNGVNNPAALMQGRDGNFYGVTGNGGLYGMGTVFRLTPAGALTVLASFNGPNGAGPSAVLMQASDGNFYGTTSSGGSSGFGTVFKMTPAGVLTTLCSFDGPVYGGDPRCQLVQDSSGNFYGTTTTGGDGSNGTVFKVTPAGVLTNLYVFEPGSDESYPDGSNPSGNLVQGNDGNLYGLTLDGGGPADDGVAFKITPAGVFTPLVVFNGSNGAFPGNLVKGSDGNLYGLAGGGAYGNQLIFQMTPAGVMNTVVSFDTAEATASNCFVVGSDGSFYGTSGAGGAFDDGTIYKVTVPRFLSGSSGDGFHALPLSSAEAGTFTATFDATPSASPENAVVGLSKGAVTGYSGLSCNVRFNPAGDIDAYNKTGYAAKATIPYSVNKTYHFRLVVNVSAHTYSIYVTPPGGSEKTVGLNYGFRTTPSILDTWNLEVDSKPGTCSLTANNLNP